MNKLEPTIIDKAIMYADIHHRGFNRKGKDIPYILHPLEVMAIISTITHDHELIVAGALHDLIEDTDITYDDIKSEFGVRVADIVASESQNMIEGYNDNLSWKETKLLALNNLKNASLDAKIVALGDKLSNIRAIHNDVYLHGLDIWKIFNEKNPSLHKWRYYELTKCFEGLEDTLAYKEFKYLVEDTFKDVD